MGMLARFLVSRPALADRISWAGSLSMGLFSSVLVLTLLRDLLLLLVGLPSIATLTAEAVLLGAALLTLIGFVNARRVARVVRIDIPLADLPVPLTGFTIVQISDIHVGATIKGDYVTAIVDRVNSLGADLIAITGDVVDGSVAQLSSHTAPLARLVARHGAYVVKGNHEYYSGAAAWMEEFQRLGLRGLMNEHVVIEHDGAQLLVAGVTDYSAHAFDLAQRSDPQLALVGSPDGIPRILPRPPATFGTRSASRRLRSATLRAHPWRAILAVESVCQPAAAIHGRTSSAGPTVGLYQPWNRLLGSSQALRCAF